MQNDHNQRRAMREDRQQGSSEPIESVVARIDERTKSLSTAVEEVKDRLDSLYVTHEAFRPVKMLVYGAVALTLTGLLTAMLALVMRSS